MALVGEIRLGQVGDGAVDPEAVALPGGATPSLAARSASRQDLMRAGRNARCAQVRGNDISIIFQEPMTSLNPLHTIEKQIGEILLTASGHHAARQRARA